MIAVIYSYIEYIIINIL